ncbi:intermembrane transport protein PqiB [Motiliproteus sediminis]|uniref:PqiB family protein n=1 Tax=Motiliproteus sediminis TaxID=1468178 RepID=UPI001AF00EB1|nr:MlaD family protein [Motiliproteus sediminis]
MKQQAVNDATVHRERGISPVWLVPLVAVLVAAWLGLQSWRERGVEVVINFESAAGIEVNKTELRFKDVRVGVVRRVQLSSDLSKVQVTAEVVPEIADRLSANSAFWVVSPKISASGITGLNTLISGVYIGVDPGEPGETLDQFSGSLTPVRIDSDSAGSRYQLRANSLGSLNIGSPVYYREVPVGEVLDYELQADGSSVVIDLFVREPFNRHVHRESRFWNVSGFGVDISDRGVRAHMSSLTSLVAGGIAFDTPEDERDPVAATEGQSFILYPDRQAVNDGVYTLKYFYKLNFNGSVRGLNVGSPVEFRGIPVGEVVSIRFAESEGERIDIQVVVAFEPQRLHGDSLMNYQDFSDRLQRLVERGLKAQLKAGNLLTGALFVDLVFEPEDPGLVVVQQGDYPLLPTAEAPLDQVSRQFTQLLSKLNQIPLEQIGSDLGSSLSSLRVLLQELEQQEFAGELSAVVTNLNRSSGQLDVTLEQAERTFAQLQQTLGNLDETVARDAPIIYDVQQMIREVTQASRSIRQLTDQLNRRPNALIFGKEER